MKERTLVIGNKNYSSWSMRAWVFLHAFKISFNERLESLNHPDRGNILARYSPSCKVPVLIDGDITVWDSLAICNYVSETYLSGRGYPFDHKKKAMAYSICQEMHSSFRQLTLELPMNCRALRNICVSEQAQREIARIDEIWNTCRCLNADCGKWLFGQFSIADCMFAPVAMRMRTYQIPLSSSSQEYKNNLLTHPSIAQWNTQALQESEVIEKEEVGEVLEESFSNR